MNTCLNYRAIHSKVLIVARMRIEGTWKAYVVPVPGRNHELEAELLWQDEGAQLREKEARVFFPELNEIPYAS